MEKRQGDDELMIMNSVIDSIYSSLNLREMREQFLHQIRDLVPFSFGDFNLGLSNSEGIPKLIDPITVSQYGKAFEYEFAYLYESKYYKMDYIHWIFRNPETFVYRESDLLNESIKNQSPFYQEFLKPLDLTHVAGMSFSKNGVFLGAASFYRASKAENFSDRDMRILDMLAPHVTRRLLQEQRHLCNTQNPNSILLKYQYQMTGREIELMGYLLYGYSYSEISDKMGISVNTVKTHISHIFQKLAINSRSQLVKFILSKDLVTVWDPQKYGV